MRVGWRGQAHEPAARHQKSIECAVVFVGNMGEVIIGEGRIKMPAVPVDARLHGAAERGFRPAADPGLGIGRDVRGIDRAERRRHRKAAGEIMSVADRVTVVAIADRGKITPTLDERAVKRLRRRRLDGCNRRPPHDCCDRNRYSDRGHGNDASEYPRRCFYHSHLLLSRLGACVLPRASCRLLH